MKICFGIPIKILLFSEIVDIKRFKAIKKHRRYKVWLSSFQVLKRSLNTMFFISCIYKN